MNPITEFENKFLQVFVLVVFIVIVLIFLIKKILRINSFVFGGGNPKTIESIKAICVNSIILWTLFYLWIFVSWCITYKLLGYSFDTNDLLVWLKFIKIFPMIVIVSILLQLFENWLKTLKRKKTSSC